MSQNRYLFLTKFFLENVRMFIETLFSLSMCNIFDHLSYIGQHAIHLSKGLKAQLTTFIFDNKRRGYKEFGPLGEIHRYPLEFNNDVMNIKGQG